MKCPLCDYYGEHCPEHGRLVRLECIACDRFYVAISQTRGYLHRHICDPRILAARDTDRSYHHALDQDRTIHDRLRDAELMSSMEDDS